MSMCDQYTQLCSEKTLQTNRDGFFLDFANAVAQKAGQKWVKNVFGKLTTDRDRIRSVYEDDKTREYVVEFLSNFQEIYRKKCPETSRRTRLEAQHCLKSGDSAKAMALFSQSVLRAPEGDQNLALALFARAKLLMSMSHPSNALTDLQLCLKSNLPSSFKPEAFLRMSSCYQTLQQPDKAQVAHNLAAKLSGKDLQVLERKLDLHCHPSKTCKKTLPPPVHGQPHPQFPNASSKIKVKTSTEAGRYVVANEEVLTGHVLVAEPPQVSVLFPEKFGTHCHHCFDRLLSPIGCPHCCGVAFCQPACREAATASYHRYECRYLALLIGSGMSVLSHAALRIVTQLSLDQSLSLYQNQATDRLYSLCTNASKRCASDFLQRTLMAAFLLRCLQKSGYFGGDGEAVVPTEAQYQVGELLLTGLQILQFNAHEVFETLCTKERLKGGKLSYVGVALYPTVALFNHECYPAVTRHFVGKHIVIRTVRPLGPDEVIAENYGPVFTSCKLGERQRCLSARYWFDCCCQACREDWPTLKEAPPTARVRCTNINCLHLFPSTTASLECPRCQTSAAENASVLKKCDAEYEKGLKLKTEGDREGAITALCSALDAFHRVSAQPHRGTLLAQEALRRCFADEGNVVECPVGNTK